MIRLPGPEELIGEGCRIGIIYRVAEPITIIAIEHRADAYRTR